MEHKKMIAIFAMFSLVLTSFAFALTPTIQTKVTSNELVDPGMKYCNALKGAFQSSYQKTVGQTDYSASLDFNHDGKINLSDLVLFGMMYNKAYNGNLEARTNCMNLVATL